MNSLLPTLIGLKKSAAVYVNYVNVFLSPYFALAKNYLHLDDSYIPPFLNNPLAFFSFLLFFINNLIWNLSAVFSRFFLLFYPLVYTQLTIRNKTGEESHHKNLMKFWFVFGIYDTLQNLFGSVLDIIPFSSYLRVVGFVLLFRNNFHYSGVVYDVFASLYDKYLGDSLVNTYVQDMEYLTVELSEDQAEQSNKQRSIKKQDEQPEEQSNEESSEESSEEPSEESSEQSEEQPFEQSSEQSSEQPSAQSSDQPSAQSNEQSVEQSNTSTTDPSLDAQPDNSLNDESLMSQA